MSRWQAAARPRAYAPGAAENIIDEGENAAAGMEDADFRVDRWQPRMGETVLRWDEPARRGARGRFSF
jgi:hypothetical protein